MALTSNAKPEPLWIERIAAGQPPRLRKSGESAEDYRVAMGWDQPPAPITPEADAELCWALRQFVKLIPAGDECRLLLTIDHQSFFIGMETMPEDEAAHFAGQFVFALAGMVKQVTAGVATDQPTKGGA